MAESKNGNLVLSRSVGESIKFRVHGVEFEVVLGHYTRQRAKFSIRAPLCVEVVRSELKFREAATA